MKQVEEEYLIYSYEMGNAVYVGLTKDLYRRDKDHRNKKKPDTLCKFCIEKGIEVPEPSILENSLTGIEAQSKEKDWVEYYNSIGFNVLNKAKCGVYVSSLGWHSPRTTMDEKYNNRIKQKVDYTYEECKEIAERAGSYNKFILTNKRAYYISYENGWLEEFGLIHNKRRNENRDIDEITYERYLEKIKECNSITEFRLIYNRYYKWGKDNGYDNKSYFKEKKERVYDTKLDDIFGKYSEDEIKEKLSVYKGRTELFKKDRCFYEFCREHGYLCYVKGCKEVGEYYRKLIEVKCDMDRVNKMIAIKGYDSFYFDTHELKVFKVKNKRVKEVIPHHNIDGVLCYVITRNRCNVNVSYNKILRIALGYNDCNYAEYIDGDYDNRNIDNIRFSKFDIGSSLVMFPYRGYHINRDGEIYDEKLELVTKGRKYDDGYYFRGMRMDIVVTNLFITNIGFDKDVRMIHDNGDAFDNRVENLLLPYKGVKRVEVSNHNGSNSIYVVNEHNERVLLGDIKMGCIVNEVIEEIERRCESNPYVSKWIYDFKENEYQTFVDRDLKMIRDKIRTESSGCYWNKERNNWKSKVWYNNKEWSLGYFNRFNEGKLMYETAALNIRYGTFEKWYRSIEFERERIKSYEMS